MPTLKQVTCSLELGPNNTKLREYGHRFTDGGVEAFVAVPEADIPFKVHVTSNGYIAPGLAAYLFIDGQYQANRNRQRLQTPSPSTNPREYEVDFYLRQREEKTSEGMFVAREWTFSKLQTANADMAPNINSNFTENVGTIEIVILRCKDGGDEASNEYLTDPAGAPAGIHQPVYAAQKALSERALSKAAFKAPSIVSTKKASEAGGSMMGGMFGLFDGAGDHPGYAPYTPRFPRDVHYRDDHYEQRPYTVHGGRDYGGRPRHELDNVYDPRPRTSADHYQPASPFGFQQRRGIDPRLPPPMPQPQPMDRVIYHPYQQPPPAQYGSTPEGFHFVRSLCQQLEDLFRLQYEERQKLRELQQEAHMNRHDAEVHLAAVKAARSKKQELSALQEEHSALWSSLLTRMNRMDEAGWNFVRDYIVLEKRLVPMSHPQLQQWRDSRLQEFGTPMQATQSAHGSGAASWAEVGQGQVQGGLAERKQKEYQNSSGQQNGQGAWGANDQQGNGNDWNQQNDQGQGNDNWAQQSQNNNNAWGDGNKSNKTQSNKSRGWGGGSNNNNGGNDAWGQQNASRHSQSNRGQSQAQGWGNSGNNGGGGGGDWGGNGNDAKSQSAKSKVKTWNDGGGGGGGGNDGWGGGSKHASRSSNRPRNKGDATTMLEPVIKPYWADWEKPDDNAGKLRGKPREPYEYPALPPPVVASGKPSGVNYGVQAGRGANYTHPTYRPEYLDTMQKPYAIFTFKYRSKAALEKILQKKIDVGDVQRAIYEAEKEKMKQMPKDDLVSNLMKLKLKGGSGGGGGGGNAPSRAASGKPATKAPSKKNDGSGGDNGGGGWDGGKGEVKPNESASQWGGNNNNDAQGGWGNNDQGGGGGDDWGDNKSKSKSKSKAGGGGDDWGGNNNNDAGGWDNNDAGGSGGGGGGWGGNDNKTEEHFAGDPNLKQTGGEQKASGSWAAAGW